MTQRFNSYGTGCGYPPFGYAPGFSPGGYFWGMQAGGWPFYGNPVPFRPPHFPSYPGAYAPPVDDRDIRRMVVEYLKHDPRLSPKAEIMIDVSHGIVTLSGTTPDKWTKYFAGEDCFNIPATVDVNNKMKIVAERREEEPQKRTRRPK